MEKLQGNPEETTEKEGRPFTIKKNKGLMYVLEIIISD